MANAAQGILLDDDTWLNSLDRISRVRGCPAYSTVAGASSIAVVEVFVACEMGNRVTLSTTALWIS